MTELVGRDRDQRGQQVRLGYRNGHGELHVSTTAGPVALERTRRRTPPSRLPRGGWTRASAHQRAAVAGAVGVRTWLARGDVEAAADGHCYAMQETITMTYTHRTLIEAPVETVFNFFKDPKNWQELPHADQVTQVNVTEEGVGTYYRVVLPIPGICIEASGVFTEFIPNQRITDRSSLSLAGALTFSFEPEGSGMKLTMESHPRSFWRIPPLKQLAEWVMARRHKRYMSALKARMETQG